MNSLQKCNAHTSQQFGRLRSNRFGENGLTDACRAVFSKQAAPRSHAFLSCHEPLPPDSRCGELRGGLSSRPPGVGTATCNFEAAAESACRQYRAARWFLLPKVELAAAGRQVAGNEQSAATITAPSPGTTATAHHCDNKAAGLQTRLTTNDRLGRLQICRNQALREAAI